MSSRKELFDAKIEIATLKIELDAIKRELASVSANLIFERGSRQEFERSAHELATKNAVLLERLDLVSNFIPATPQAHSWPEEAEDAQWQLDHGEIDHTQFEDILRQTGALNTEVAFDGSDYPRLGSS